MDEIGRIFLSWKKGPGTRRYIVGLIKRNSTEGATFSYLLPEVEKASQEGFKPYIDFPNATKVYRENVLDIFGQRLVKFERTDSKEFINFWKLDPRFIEDKYYLLAHTQGWLPTDTFEFLAEFYPVRGLIFVSDLAGLSYFDFDEKLLIPGEKLDFILEPQNRYDKEAVLVISKGKKVGYIKKIHNRVFYKQRSTSLKVKVKSVETSQTGKRVFVEISL
jgi:hypothetical protein